ncbi:group II intron maturase-specific domain-containing protein [Paraburkholderia humisilvae]
MRQRTRKARFQTRTYLMADIARMHNPVLRGWLSYYGKFSPSAMYPVLRHFNRMLTAWAVRKYKRLKGHRTPAPLFVEGIAKRQPRLFDCSYIGNGG